MSIVKFQERRGIAAHDRGREDGESSEQEYAVEAVMGYRFEKGKAQLLVKWDGETMRKSTWEPLSSFNGACKIDPCRVVVPPSTD